MMAEDLAEVITGHNEASVHFDNKSRCERQKGLQLRDALVLLQVLLPRSLELYEFLPCRPDGPVGR